MDNYVSPSGNVPGYSNGEFNATVCFSCAQSLTDYTPPIAIMGNVYFRPAANLTNPAATDKIRMASDVAAAFPTE